MMYLDDRIKLLEQTIEAIKAWKKNDEIKLESSTDGFFWIKALPSWASNFYRIAKPEPKKVKYYRPIVKFKENERLDTNFTWRTDKKTNFDSFGDLIGWDERTFDIPEEES